MVFYNKYIPGLNRAEEEASFKTAYKITAKEYPPKVFSGVKEVLQKFKENGDVSEFLEIKNPGSTASWLRGK